MKEDTKARKATLEAALKRAIITLELQPGEALDEASLCETYGLSRTPLREVIRALAGEGYLTVLPNRGARVSDMSYRTLRDFFLAAPMIYGAVLRLAAENGTRKQVNALKQAQTEFRAALEAGNVRDRTMANNQFHAITGEMAGNIYLAPSFNRLLIDHARIGMTFYRPRDAGMAENLRLASQQHDAMIDSIEAGDGSAAAALAADHWSLSRNQLESFVTPAALDETLGRVPAAATG